jgi:hypothetical protein
MNHLRSNFVMEKQGVKENIDPSVNWLLILLRSVSSCGMIASEVVVVKEFRDESHD